MNPRVSIIRDNIEELLAAQNRLDRHLNNWKSRHPEYKYDLEIVSDPKGFYLKATVYEEHQY